MYKKKLLFKIYSPIQITAEKLEP